MIAPPSILIFFGSRTLSDEQFLDEKMRERTMNEGIAAIRARIGGLTVVTKLPDSCAVAVKGTEESIRGLKSFLDESKIGQYEEDSWQDPILRAALVPESD